MTKVYSTELHFKIKKNGRKCVGMRKIFCYKTAEKIYKSTGKKQKTETLNNIL